MVLVGAGGHALSVIDSLQAKDEYEIVGITDMIKVVGEKVLDYEVIGNDTLLKPIFECGVPFAFITVGSIGDTSLRKNLFDRLKDIGFTLPTIVDPTARIGRNVHLGEGVYIGKNTVINPHSEIGDMTIINTGAIIEHGCHIKEFSHVGSGAVICGDVKIGAHTHIGANATVIQGLSIGKNSIIGAGSVVVHDLPQQVIAYGNPCKVVKNNERVYNS
ncbi:acetyltransferase [Desulfitobacterium sp.]|uniref:acetyltransferase n=1 Tax=Desulfitobacterium sp. TaxID=49981 RepID=UPI002C6AC2DF|nr:acetyltransferase [Desulfitobacterium sp.]HVJ50744.1 acetyltransferase [Desulfitobacterium sp.]